MGLVLTLAACTDDGGGTDRTTTVRATATTVAPTDLVPGRWYNAEAVAYGRGVYAANCATCHGPNAEGAPDWQVPDAEGKAPPPPLNGTAHAWHHPAKGLYTVIMKGSPGGAGNMPAWRGKLGDTEVVAVLAWFQSLWPDQIYAQWQKIEQRALDQ